MNEGNPVLAEHLRALRKRGKLTQAQLAQEFGVSTGLLSSWENPKVAVVPPFARLEAYADFFASRLPGEHRTDQEHDEPGSTAEAREVILKELKALSNGYDTPAAPAPDLPPDHSWLFPAGDKIVIACAKLPPHLQAHPYADLSNPDYVEMYTYADLDSLFALHGHIRACNPSNEVVFRATDAETALLQDDYTAHLILLGGVDWNVYTKRILSADNSPVKQVERDGPSGPLGGFETPGADGHPDFFAAELDSDGVLVADVALFYRAVNPFNRKRTVTICNGTFGRGTLGAVRALTDVRFRDRNQKYLNSRFISAEQFCIISRVPVVGQQALTPDWTLEENRLFEWP